MKFRINMEVKFIISLIFAVLVAVFAIQNAGNVEINFLFTKFTISQAVVILSSAIVGAFIVVLLSLVKQIKQNMKIKQLNKEMGVVLEEKEKLQTQVDELALISTKKEEIVDDRIEVAEAETIDESLDKLEEK
ncbi:MAG: LapA family protein [Tissierellales bacterium]